MDDRPEIAEHPAFQAGTWRVQRVAWVVMGLMLCAALTGLTGRGGPLSRQVLDAPFGRIEAPRVARQGAPVELLVHVAAGQDAASVTLDAGFLDAFAVQSIVPAPQDQVAQDAALTLALRTEGAERTIRLVVRPLAPGLVRYGVAVGAAGASLRTLILP